MSVNENKRTIQDRFAQASIMILCVVGGLWMMQNGLNNDNVLQRLVAAAGFCVVAVGVPCSFLIRLPRTS